MLPWPVRARSSNRLDRSTIGSFTFFFLKPGGPTFLPPPNSLENRPTGHPFKRGSRNVNRTPNYRTRRQSRRALVPHSAFRLPRSLSFAIVDDPSHLGPQVLPVDDPVDEPVLQQELARLEPLGQLDP